MDLRLAVFERIAGDAVLRRLLLNYADRLDDRNGTGVLASDTCYVTLEWSSGDRAGALLDAESVTVRAHMPRSRAEEHRYLDIVLHRLDAALQVGDADGALKVLRRRTPPEAVETGADTIFKTRTYDVAPLETQRGLPFPGDPRSIGPVPPNSAAPGYR